ncbi:MAG: hypothetical protein ACYC7E_04630 [Armatimonadota bacterium]
MDAMGEHLPQLLRYLDSTADGVIRIDRWRVLPNDVRERLEQAALFTSRCTSLAVCDQCWRACLVELEQSITEPRDIFTAYCEDDDTPISVVRVKREQAMIRTPQWATVTDRLRRAYQAYGLARELIAGRLWHIGRVREPHGSASFPVYLARGIWWPHDRTVYQYLASPEREANAIVFQFAEPVPPVALPTALSLRLLSLEDCLTIDAEGHLIIDIAGLVTSTERESPGLAVDSSPPKYRLILRPDALAVDIGGKCARLTSKVFAVLHALCRFHQQAKDTWRPQNRIAEEVYAKDSMPDNVRQAITGRIKIIRDALVNAGCILPEDRDTFIEAESSGGGYRINKLLVTVDIS